MNRIQSSEGRESLATRNARVRGIAIGFGLRGIGRERSSLLSARTFRYRFYGGEAEQKNEPRMDTN
jgi:hypothetical protein